MVRIYKYFNQDQKSLHVENCKLIVHIQSQMICGTQEIKGEREPSAVYGKRSTLCLASRFTLLNLDKKKVGAYCSLENKSKTTLIFY